MKSIYETIFALILGCLSPLSVQAATYIWDNQNANGIWNDPVNWGIGGNPNDNHAPTILDTVAFRNDSPAGTVTLTNDGAAARIRQNATARVWTITIDPSQTVDRTLTLGGTAAELFDFAFAATDYTIDGTPNGSGAKLKLVINGTQSSCPVNTNASLTLNCEVSGTNGFTLDAGYAGTGTLVLGGTNIYTGATTVNAGRLLVNGSTAVASSVTVSGGRLGGTGTIGGAVTVGSAGSIGAGASVGSLTLQNGLDLSAGGTNVWELAAVSTSNPGTDFDQIVLTGGTLTLGGSSTLSIRFTGSATAPDSSNPFWQSARSWTVILASGVASNFGAVENGNYPAGNFTTSAEGSGIVLTFSPGAPAVAKPLITSLVGAGTTNVIVNYTNTLAATNYTLQYNTNLSATNWHDVGTAPASGTSASQTDSPPAGDPQRYYRVFYVTP